MNAITGEYRPKTAQLLCTPTLSGDTFPQSDLSYSATPNGVLVTANGLMVAWIYPGHAGSRNNPRACQFYDVAYPSLTFGQQNRVTGILIV